VEIEEIITDLKSLRSDSSYRAAVDCNLELFRALRFPISFFWWSVFRIPRLRKRRTQLAELGDLPFPCWQQSILETLSGFEAEVPLMLTPIREGIVAELERLREVQKKPALLISVGCGGMELERQVMFQLLRARSQAPVVFFGVDSSPAVLDVITAKFRPLVAKKLLRIETASRLSADDLKKFEQKAAAQRFLLVLVSTDVFELSDLPEDSFNLVYHTRLRHHLTPEESRRLDQLSAHLAPKIMELDDLFSIPQIVLAGVFAWRFPAALGAVIFSYLRDRSKKELLSQPVPGWTVSFCRNPIWCHLSVYDKAVAGDQVFGPSG